MIFIVAQISPPEARFFVRKIASAADGKLKAPDDAHLDLRATVLHHRHPGRPRLCRRALIPDAKLHPDDLQRGQSGQRFIDDRCHRVRAAEYVDHLDRIPLRDVRQRGPDHFGAVMTARLPGIDRNHPHPPRHQEIGDPVRGPLGIGRPAHNSNHFRARQDRTDRGVIRIVHAPPSQKKAPEPRAGRQSRNEGQ